jgi:hypothetical protein
MSLARGVPILEQVPTGQAAPLAAAAPLSAHTPPEQLPLPLIRSAEASVVKIGAGIDRLRIASATEVHPAIVHFMKSPFKMTGVETIHLPGRCDT